MSVQMKMFLVSSVIINKLVFYDESGKSEMQVDCYFHLQQSDGNRHWKREKRIIIL